MKKLLPIGEDVIKSIVLHLGNIVLLFREEVTMPCVVTTKGRCGGL